MRKIEKTLTPIKVKSNDSDYIKLVSNKNIKKIYVQSNLFYAISLIIVLIFCCIILIWLFHVIGGILINPLLIFAIVIITVLYAMIETICLIEKDIDEKNKKLNTYNDDIRE